MPGTQQIRQQERREQKLRDIRQQVAQGTLVIREMTPAERKRYLSDTTEPARQPSRRRR